jgi:hypothetical protein
MNANQRGPNSEERGMAELIIKTHLKDGRWHPSKLIIDFAGDRSVRYETVKKISQELGIEKNYHRGSWFWRLPQSKSPHPVFDEPLSRFHGILRSRGGVLAAHTRRPTNR